MAPHRRRKIRITSGGDSRLGLDSALTELTLPLYNDFDWKIWTDW